ncbi:hypothetical protein K8I28_10555 [bacterium]|nr:hypothetical protein [bacterium]
MLEGRYHAGREEDLPPILLGLILSVSMVINSYYFGKTQVSELILIILIIILRIIAKKSMIVHSGDLWTFSALFKRPLTLKDNQLERFEVLTSLKRYQLRIVYKRGGNELYYHITAPGFNLLKFIQNVAVSTPQRLGQTAIFFLAEQEKFKKAKIDRLAGVLSVSALILAVMCILEMRKPVPALFLSIGDLIIPGTFLGLIALTLLLRYRRYRWANPPLAYISLAGFVILELLANQLLTSMNSISAPGVMEVSFYIHALIFLFLGFWAFLLSGRVGSTVIFTFVFLLAVFGEFYSPTSKFQLRHTLGEQSGVLQALGWSGGDQDYFWMVEVNKEGAFSGITIDQKDESCYQIELPQSSVHKSAATLFIPLNDSTALENLGNRILLHNLKNDSTYILWDDNQETDNADLEEGLWEILTPPVLYPSPDGRHVAWNDASQKIYIADISSLGILVLSGTALSTAMVGWANNDSILYQDVYPERNDLSQYQLKSYSITSKSTTLVSSTRVLWKCICNTPDFILAGKSVDSDSSGQWSIRSDSSTVFFDLPDEELNRLCDLIEIESLTKNTFALLFKGTDKKSPLAYVAVVDSRGNLLHFTEPLPGNPLDLAANSQGITLILENNLVYDCWRIEKKSDRWVDSLEERLLLSYTKLARSGNGQGLFSADGSQFVWPYAKYLGNSGTDALAIWEVH